jgi:hypothetical protein
VDTSTEDFKIEYRFEPTPEADERLARALDLLLWLILADSLPKPPAEFVAPPLEILR